MSERDDLIYAQHIRDAIARVEKYIGGMNREGFMSDERTQDAVIRQLEIIGEACKRLSEGFKTQYVGVSWSSAAGMRDVLIHDYFGVDLDIVWDTLKRDLPAMAKVITVAIGE